jgi:hypothetical protein
MDLDPLDLKFFFLFKEEGEKIWPFPTCMHAPKVEKDEKIYMGRIEANVIARIAKKCARPNKH